MSSQNLQLQRLEAEAGRCLQQQQEEPAQAEVKGAQEQQRHLAKRKMLDLCELCPPPPSPSSPSPRQCSVSDLNRAPVSSVFRAGPQPRCCEFSVPRRTSTAMM